MPPWPTRAGERWSPEPRAGSAPSSRARFGRAASRWCSWRAGRIASRRSSPSWEASPRPWRSRPTSRARARPSSSRRQLDDRGLAIDGLVNCAGLGLTGPFAAQDAAVDPSDVRRERAGRGRADPRVPAADAREAARPDRQRGLERRLPADPVPRRLRGHEGIRAFVHRGARLGARRHRNPGPGALPRDHVDGVPRRLRRPAASSG